MLRNILCVAMRKKIENLIYEFDNLLRGYQILRENVRENEIPVMGHASCSVSDFHSLLTSFQTLLENTCEKDFLNYVRNEDDVRSKYIEMSNEHENLKTAYQAATQNITELDSRLKETVSERDELIRMFDELKEMSEKGSLRKLPSVPKSRIKSIMESVQKLTDKRLPSHLLHNMTTSNEQSKSQAQENNSLLPYFCDTSSECFKTEVFIPGSPRVHSPELLIPDSVDEYREDAENEVSDQVRVSGDVQVITVTWDELTDKSSDEEDYRAVRRERKRKSESAFSNHWLSCKTCGRQFTKKNNLDRHEILHTSFGKQRPFSCSLCPKTYVNNGDLKRHMRTHTDERYYCSICNKSFTQNGTLTRHLKIHANVREFICNDCNKAYTSKWALKGHIVLKQCPFAKY